MPWDYELTIDALNKTGDVAMLVAKHGRGRLAEMAGVIGLVLKGSASAFQRDPELDLDGLLSRIRGPRVLTGWPEADDTAQDTPRAKKKAKEDGNE